MMGVHPEPVALPVLDPAAFECTAAYLAPESLASCLQSLAERGEGLLHDLHAPDALALDLDALAAAAHTLAGSGGMFGFERLAAVAHRFEHAVHTNAVEVPAVADSLAAAITVSVQEMRRRIPGALDASSLTGPA